METGSFNTLFGSVELMRPLGEPKVFVLAGAGKGIPVYRLFQKHRVPFSTGILFENDVDFQVAKVLASHIIQAQAFSVLTEEQIAEAKVWIDKAEYVVEAEVPLGEQNQRYEELLTYIRETGKKVMTVREAFTQVGTLTD